MKNYLTDYIESKGYTVQECRRPAKKEVPASMRDRYSSYEEYEEALHDFLNGMWSCVSFSPLSLLSSVLQSAPTLSTLSLKCKTLKCLASVNLSLLVLPMIKNVQNIDDGDWDDMLSPDDYEDLLDRKRFNKSQGNYAWHNISIQNDYFKGTND